jgi:hypothetical protein
MFARLWDVVFGCWHAHYSFPITLRTGSRSNPAASLTGTYVVCLDCGKEFPYDWTEMKVISSPQSNHGRLGSLATRPAA